MFKDKRAIFPENYVVVCFFALDFYRPDLYFRKKKILM